MHTFVLNLSLDQFLADVWMKSPTNLKTLWFDVSYYCSARIMLTIPLDRCIMLPKFNAKDIWLKFMDKATNCEERPSIFMGVPTMYSKLLESYETLYGSNLQMLEYVRAMCSSNFRYFVCVSIPFFLVIQIDSIYLWFSIFLYFCY